MRQPQILFCLIALMVGLGACAPAASPAPVAATVPPAPPTAAQVEPTATSAPPTATPVPPTATSAPPTAPPTALPEPTETAVPATATPIPPSPVPPTAAPTAAASAAPTQPPAKAAVDPAAAQRLWMQSPCQGCHGANAEGASGPRLAGTMLSYEQVLRQVRNGGGRMPPYAPESISDKDLETIHAWLQSLPGQ